MFQTNLYIQYGGYLLCLICLALSSGQKLTRTCGVVHIDMKAVSHLSQAGASIHLP